MTNKPINVTQLISEFETESIQAHSRSLGQEHMNEWLTERISSLLESVAEERDRAMKLLEVAKCPDTDCDNHGTLAVRISDDEWEPQQCQWCYEKGEIIRSAKSNENRSE